VRSNLEARATRAATEDPKGAPIAMDPQGATIGLQTGSKTFQFGDSKVSNKRYVVLGRAGRARSLAQADCTPEKGCKT
jgi:hypothetical protein